MTRKLLLVTLVMIPGGCQGIAYLGQLLIPHPPPKTVKAEFDGLRNSNVAIVIHADPIVAYEYPAAQLELSLQIASQLREHVKGATVTDPRNVLRYQQENLYWSEMDRTKLGEALKGDYVLLVALIQYTMREPGSIGLYRGRIEAEVSLYDTSRDERSACVWRSPSIGVVFPPDTPTGQPAQSDRNIRYQVTAIFADKLVEKFYKHKIPRSL